MDARRLTLVAAAAALLLLGAALGYALAPSRQASEPDVRAVAEAALLSIRDQGRTIVFAGRYVAIVTASESRLGLTASKTLILPGGVRYGVDMSRLTRRNLAWDEQSKTLTVTLPPLEISGPDIDLNEVRERSEGGIIMALTDAEQTLDEANRRSAQDELMRQARAQRPMHLAREAAMRSVARSFAVPLRAAGIEASVVARFVDPAGRDRPRATEQRLQDRQADGEER
jgi:hypothetical protein